MRAVTKSWLTFAILAALSGACGDSGGSNDGETNGGATAGTNTGDSAGTNGSSTNGTNTNGSGSNGTNNTSNTGSTAGDGGNTGVSAGDGGGDGGDLPAASECGAQADGLPLDTSAAGGCYYFYCYTTEDSLLAASSQGGACANETDVAIQCEGSSVRAVSKCARENAMLAGNAKTFADAIAACAKPDLPGFSDACLDCNVQSAVCAGKLANCLTTCLNGDSPECDKCRQDKGCTPDFYKCAGLPDPMM